MKTPLALGNQDPRHRAMAVSLAVSFLMLVGKLTAYAITGSAAIFSDAAESVIHLVATAFVGFSLWYAVRPADTGHPYGHGKIAYFSSGMEGLLIVVAALTIFYSAIRALLLGSSLSQLGVGIGLLAGLGIVNLLLGLYLRSVGQRYNSIVLISNGQHVLSDMWTSLGVIVGVALVSITGLQWLDPLVAALVASHLLWTGAKLVRRSFHGLMEQADGADSQAILLHLDAVVAEGIITGYHQVRHRRVNDQVWIECHFHFPGNLSLSEAHERSHAVEEGLVDLFPQDQVVVTAHLEPDAHDEAHPSGHEEPVDPLRQVDFEL